MIKVLSKILFLNLLLFLQSTVYPQTAYSVKQFTMQDGLSANRYLSICSDKHGFYWFGSENGLQQFDGYVFRSFPVVCPSHFKTEHYNVIDQKALDNGNILFATSIGLLIYSYNTGQLSWLAIGNDSTKYQAVKICSINDTLHLIGTSNSKGLLVYNSKQNTVQYATNKINKFFNSSDLRYIFSGLKSSILIENNRLYYEVDYLKQTIRPFDCGTLPRSNHIIKSYIDKQNVLWLATELGIYTKKQGQKTERLTSIDSYCALKDQICTDIAACNDSTIYLSFDWQGVIRINTFTKKITAILRNEKNNSSEVISNAVRNMYSIDEKSFWVTGNEGAYLVKPDNSDIHFYDINSQNGLQASAIMCILEDSHGTIWVATDGGGLHRFSLETKQFIPYKHENEHSNAPGSNMIVSLYEEKSGKNIWIGTYNGGLSCYNYASKRFTNYFYQASSSKSLLKNNVWCITEDKNNKLLVSSFCESISILDRKTNTWSNATKENGGIECDCISALLTDPEGQVWTGSVSCGLGLFDSNKKITFSTNETVNSIVNDGDYLWVGMSSGLRKFNKKTLQYADFVGQAAFNNMKINCIYQDASQNLWIAANNTLYTYNKKTGEVEYSYFSHYFKGYDISYITQTKDGHLLIGGRSGMLIVPPKSITFTETRPLQLSLTEMRLFGEAIQPGKDAVIKTHCNFLKAIELPYNQNYIGFSFSVLQATQVNNVNYSCKLTGLDKKWIMIDAGKNSIDYSNLQPDNYSLHIRAISKYNPAIYTERVINIRILPPYWRTWWFRLLISSIVITCLLLFYFYRIRQLNRQQTLLEKTVLERTAQIASQKEELVIQAETLEDQYLSLKEKQKELELVVADLQRSNNTKNKLFSIISHDLNSPLSGIYGIISTLFDRSESLNKERKKDLIENTLLSLQSIQTLIDNLLQWSRSQSDGIIFHYIDIPLTELMVDTCNPLKAAMNNKQISFSMNIPNSLSVYADQNTIATVIRNIVQNAIKFCPKDGTITVEATEIDNSVRIEITDTGSGMEQSLIDRIIHSKNTESQVGTLGEKGTGLGLEISKDFIQKNNGQLFITSQINKGTVVSVLLPLSLQPGNTVETRTEELESTIEISELSLPTDTILLIVDDNPLIREHIISLIGNRITIIEAQNGQVGYEKALECIPDIIISDVAMPIMDGFEMCKKLTATTETSHIPIILLTAKTSAASRMEGLSSGAIDYLTKPFNENELVMKLSNILTIRKKQQLFIQEQIIALPTEKSAPIVEDPFLTKVFSIIDQNISNPDFYVEQLSSALSMSKVTSYRKIKALINKSPNDLINEMRLRKAKELLATQQYRVSEVAYKVGFDDPKYFTRKFKELFDSTPSEFIG
jgi:signal transduction histidine kinase/CheY-like chemotaxis protein/ligand-binding sensor domain-containing protein/AraC-like DNA-binding protein